MKTLIKIFAGTLTMIILFTNLSFGQGTELNLQRSISLSGDSEREEIEIEVEDETLNLNISIKSTLKAGGLTIEIYDPNWVKQGNFSVGIQLNLNKPSSELKDNKSKNEVVNGQIEKKVKEPIAGNWVIRIIPNRAEGSVSILSKQIYADN